MGPKRRNTIAQDDNVKQCTYYSNFYNNIYIFGKFNRERAKAWVGVLQCFSLQYPFAQIVARQLISHQVRFRFDSVKFYDNFMYI